MERGPLTQDTHRHAEQVLKNGNIDPEEVRKITYLHEFDREIQCPTWGYATEGAYYRDASSADSVLSIRVPTFAIHAEDDPVSFAAYRTAIALLTISDRRR